MRTFSGLRLRLCLAIVACVALAACGGGTPATTTGSFDDRINEEGGLLFGTPVWLIGGPDERAAQAGSGGGIGVNAFLWRASLDTIDFMPLTSADPFGGVIITDWYAPPNAPDERLKVNVFIMDTTLRADALKASVFRQTRRNDGSWQDAPVESGTARQLEDTILTRARELRIAAG